MNNTHAEDTQPAAAQEAVARSPLSDQQIAELLPVIQNGWTIETYATWAIRAAERAHGITDSLAPVAAAPVEFDRARETPRRQTAVEAMLAMGFVWVWDNDAWRAQSSGDMQDEHNRWFIRAGEYLKRAQAAESKLTSTPAAPGIDPDVLEKAAIELWHRWGNDSVIEWEDESHKAEYRLAAEAVLALIDASPKDGSDASVWRGPGELPAVGRGDMGWFWVAVRRANGMTYNFPASYLNAMLLSDEDGDHDEPKSGNRYSYGAADEDDGSFPATGWHEAKEHSEYDSIYMPLLADGDELIAWRAVEDFTLQATSAEVGS